VHAVFRDLLRTMQEKGALVTTTEGRAHGDLHGGNLLQDVAGNVWLIDFATTGPGHSLTDLAKLLVACLGNYLPELPDDAAAFETLCRTIAAAPGTGLPFPKTAGLPPHLERLEDVLALLWPHLRAMDPHCAGTADQDGGASMPSCTAVVFALMRYAIRFAGRERGPPKSDETLRRFNYFACACALRLLHESGAECAWVSKAGARWKEGAVRALTQDLDRSLSDVLHPYLATTCETEAWLVDPVSFSKMRIEDACIHVQTEHLAGGVRHAADSAEAPATPGVW
jgi:hypothetical protein